jgi:hypothetical protein
MSDEEDLNAGERELECALGALHPHPPAIDRDRIMFEAGQRSVHPQYRRPVAWPVISGALAAALLVSVSLHRAPRYVERIVRVPVDSPSTTTPDRTDATPTAATWDLTAHPAVESSPPPTSYLILRKHALSVDEPQTPTDPRHGLTRSPTRDQPIMDLPDAGFFGRAPRTSRERL